MILEDKTSNSWCLQEKVVENLFPKSVSSGKTNYPIKNVLKEPDLTWRTIVFSIKWYGDYIYKRSMKWHVFPDFVGEFSSPSNLECTKVPILFIDKAYNLRGVSARVVFKGPKN